MENRTFKQIIEIRDRLPIGYKKRIATKCGVSQSFVSRVLNNDFGKLNGWKVERVLTECERVKSRRPHDPVKRSDLINNLPWGFQTRTARQLNVTSSVVAQALHGKRTQSDRIGHKIIELAEAEVARVKTHGRASRREATSGHEPKHLKNS